MISQKIDQMIKVAAALGAPLYDLDTLRAAAATIESRLAATRTDFTAMFEADTSVLDGDLAIIDAGARQAFSWIVGHAMLPSELDAQIDRHDDADKPLGRAWRVAQQYLDV